MKINNLFELKMTNQTISSAANELGTSVFVGFEFEMRVPTTSNYWVGTTIKNDEKTLMVDEISSLHEIVANFTLSHINYKRMHSDFDSWVKLQFDEYRRTAKNKSLYAVAQEWRNENDKDKLFIDWVYDDFNNMINFINEYKLTPLHGWKNKDIEFYSEEQFIAPLPLHQDTYELVSDDLRKKFSVPIEISYVEKNPNKAIDSWYIETDSSIETSDGACDLELVTNPVFLKNGIKWAKMITDWMIEMKMETDFSTGLHINMSVVDMTKFDPLKFILFVNETAILDEWERFHNPTTMRQLTMIQKSFGQDEAITKAVMSGNFHPLESSDLDAISLHLSNLLSRDKYRTVNLSKLKKGYIEIRMVGGDYMNRFHDISSNIKRFAFCLDLASDPKKYRKEYALKISRLINGISAQIDKFKPASGIPKQLQRLAALNNYLGNLIELYSKSATGSNAYALIKEIEKLPISVLKSLKSDESSFLRFIAKKHGYEINI